MTFEQWWIEQKGGQELTKYEAAKNAWYQSRLECAKEIQKLRDERNVDHDAQS